MSTTRLTAAVLGLAVVLGACSADGAPEPDRDSSSAALAQGEPSPQAQQTRRSSTLREEPAAAERLGLRTGWGPTRAELDRAARIVGGMPLRDLAGQVIVADYTGLDAPGALVNGLHLGGVIVMSGNVRSTTQVRRSNTELQRAARGAGRRWPVFVGVDQEGGVVERVKGGATRFPAFMTAGAARDQQLTRRAAAASGAELRNLGFSVVFAPDGDVTSGPADVTIGSRSAGSRPGLVARQMNAAVDGFLSAGTLPVIKHFPGHGSVAADSHVELPVQTKGLRELRRTDFVPFAAGVDGGVSSVMVAHIDVRRVDPGVPSSLSRELVTGQLRQELGFRGLVVTDALNMGAITGSWSSAGAAVRALRAGNDVVLMPSDPRSARDGIVEAVRDGRLSRSRLEQAAARQIAILLHQATVEPSTTRRPGTSNGVVRRWSTGAATVVSGPCRGRLVGRSVEATGSAATVRRFNAAARRAGLGTGTGTEVALIGYGGSPTSAGVVATTDTPYPLGESRGSRARIAMYGDTPGTMRALVDVLLGRERAPGRLPVPVAGVHRRGCPTG